MATGTTNSRAPTGVPADDCGLCGTACRAAAAAFSSPAAVTADVASLLRAPGVPLGGCWACPSAAAAEAAVAPPGAAAGAPASKPVATRFVAGLGITRGGGRPFGSSVVVACAAADTAKAAPDGLA
jgi:hypothetical protein